MARNLSGDHLHTQERLAFSSSNIILNEFGEVLTCVRVTAGWLDVAFRDGTSTELRLHGFGNARLKGDLP